MGTHGSGRASGYAGEYDLQDGSMWSGTAAYVSRKTDDPRTSSNAVEFIVEQELKDIEAGGRYREYR